MYLKAGCKYRGGGTGPQMLRHKDTGRQYNFRRTGQNKAVSTAGNYDLQINFLPQKEDSFG